MSFWAAGLNSSTTAWSRVPTTRAGSIGWRIQLRSDRWIRPTTSGAASTRRPYPSAAQTRTSRQSPGWHRG